MVCVVDHDTSAAADYPNANGFNASFFPIRERLIAIRARIFR
jgi:hypothetical protein